MKFLRLNWLILMAAMVLTAGIAHAVTIDMVPVGNPGNVADPATGNLYGSVGYNYQIGKCEITAGQYAEFLTAVAPEGPGTTTDPYGLYNGSMEGGAYGSAITYNFVTQTYTATLPNKPVNYVSWGDAARFANWMSNGQPTTGVEDLSTTEDGSYYLNGKTSDVDLMTVTRKVNATWVIPSENEWHKAAYYDPNKLGGAGYWSFPTMSNTAPINTLPDFGNNANFYDSYGTGNYGYTLSGPPYTTDVGSFAYSLSAYGTSDQGGNLWEWNDTAIGISSRGLRGGSFADYVFSFASSNSDTDYPTHEGYGFGFRVAFVPEPGSLVMTAMIAVLGLIYCWRKHASSLKRMVLVAAMVLTTGMAQAVTIDLVPVGNINNAADTQVMNDGTTGYGSVDHAYAIGKYEVTAGQYTAFLNAVGGVDTYALYNTSMSYTSYGSGIARSGGGTVGNPYTYTVDSAFVNRPVNYVSFWDAARFTNWLSNGQGTGDTETGAYTLGGYNGSDGRLIVKNAGAQWWVPSENEWYKSAYSNGGSAATDYFLYPTGSNSEPGQDMADVSGNNANYSTAPYAYPIDSGKYTTLAGEFQNSDSPYGTFDQGGNVWEWNDTVIGISGSSSRGVRGGAFNDISAIASSFRTTLGRPPYEDNNVGFRVASVPEPGSLLMTAMIAVAGLMYLWRKHA